MKEREREREREGERGLKAGYIYSLHISLCQVNIQYIVTTKTINCQLPVYFLQQTMNLITEIEHTF